MVTPFFSVKFTAGSKLEYFIKWYNIRQGISDNGRKGKKEKVQEGDVWE